MDLLTAILGLVLLAVTALAVPSALRVRGRAPFALAGLIAAAAAIVLVFEVLSLLRALTTAGILAGQLLVALAAVGAWLARGKPRPPVGWRPSRGGLRAAVREHTAVALLTAMAAGTLAIQFLVSLFVAPNNWDSMTYHLSRAAYWLQYDSALRYSGGSIRQLDSPPNAEMLQAWTIAVFGSDVAVELVQWAALVGLALAIFSGARLLRFGVAPSLFAASLFVVLPQPVLQASTTQNDLVTSVFVLAAGLFGVRGLRDRNAADIVLAAIAGGLAFGSKGTAVFAAPSLVLLLAAALMRFRPPARFVAAAAGAALAGIAAFGAFNYALNLEATGSPFGGLSEQLSRNDPVPENLLRIMWSGFVDLPGTSASWFELLLRRPAEALFPGVPKPQFAFELDTSVQEDSTGFGAVGLLLFLPLVAFFAVRRRGGGRLRLVAAAALLYPLVLATASGWNPFMGRVLIPFVALGAPLLAVLALRPGFRGAVIALAAIGLVPALLTNQQKPLLTANGGSPPVFGQGRVSQQTIIRPEMKGVINAVNRRVGSSAPLGFAGTEDTWDYPFFGPRLERRVVRMDPKTVTAERIRESGVKAVLFADAGKPPRALGGDEVGPNYYLVEP